jgi:glycosyltransferase involved in cell wall biosynthesis
LGQPDYNELVRLEEIDAYPRVVLFEDSLHSDMLNERFLEKVPPQRFAVYKKIPIVAAQIIEAFIQRKNYDVIISWAENLGIPLACLFKFSCKRPVHFGIFSWISKFKKAVLLKISHKQFDRIILMSSKQRDYAVNKIGIPEEKVILLRWPVDQKFWRPMPRETKMICAVGREMRDYGTLIHAIRDLAIPCHIAAGGLTLGKKDAWIKDVKNEGVLPSHITVGKKSYFELRELYANSRFVVIPLLETKTDNGTTSILEAMAMGKAVICSHVEGQADVIQDGINGIFVPVGDSQALQQAIEYLWIHPDVAERLGRAGRQWIEEHHTIDSFVAEVKKAVEKVVAEKKNAGSKIPPQKIRPRRSILTIISTGLSLPSYKELKQMEEEDRSPRVLLYEDTLDSDILDERFIRQTPKFKRCLYKCISPLAAQLIEGFLLRRKYKAIVTWSGKLSLGFAFILKMTGSRVLHIAMMSWISKPKKARILKRVHSHIDKIIFWSSVQKEFAENVLKIPSSKLVLVSRRVDHKFWRPLNVPMDIICTAGQEMRDFPTLLKAMDGLDIQCHIATGAIAGKLFDTVKVLEEVKQRPSNIKVNLLNYLELRALYARSRFVVIPLHQSDTDNGITTIEEAMAMGKAIICTRTQGQVDLLQDGVTGIFVPPSDHEALRKAILHLWNNPEIAERMGKNGRIYIETHHTLDKFVQSVKEVVDGAIREQESRDR